MAVDTLSRRALLEAKESGNYAPRHKVWPPAGYAGEFADLLRRAKRHRSQWERVDDATVLRLAQLCELAGSLFTGQDKGFIYDYARALRQEMNRRGITFWSIAILRCQSCSHATERLFEVTQKTHPGLESRRGPVVSAWYCARCWSGWTQGDIDDGAADEDEAEDGE